VLAGTISLLWLAFSSQAQASVLEGMQKELADHHGTAVQPSPRITQAIDDSVVVRIPNSTHPLATPVNDRGRVDAAQPMNRILLLLKPGDDQQSALMKLIDSLHDPESANHQRWLTPEQYAAEFGPAPSDLDQIASWLKQHNFTVNSVARGGQWIEFSGTAAQVETAFHTEIHTYLVHGEPHIANAMDISLPQALAPVVQAVLSLHDFRGVPMHAKMFHVRRDPASGRLAPVGNPLFTPPGGAGGHFLAPGDWARIYNTEPLLQQKITGSGISIAIVGSDTDLQLSDIRTFRQIFQLPAKDPISIINGVDPGVAPYSDQEVEADLDVEWSGAIAPDATIKFVTAASTASTFGAFLSISDIVDNRLAPIMSVSYGVCEAFLGTGGNAFLNAAYQQATAEGISVFVASGDDGAAGCDPQVSLSPAINGPNVSGFASTPYNAAVGGTMFAENGLDGDYWNANNRPDFSSAIGYIPEAVWNESCDPTVDPSQRGGTYSYFLSAGSGGPSNCTDSTVLQDGSIACQGAYAKPSWQAGTGVPNDGARDLPDLAFNSGAGHDGYITCVEGSCQTTTSDGQTTLDTATVVGGTSAASPSMAGLLALVEQSTQAYQGLINYNLYKLAAADHLSVCNSSHLTDPATPSSCTFDDVTAGNNSVPGQAGYNAARGYDMSTGLGSINAQNLAARWTSALKLPTATGLSTTTSSKQTIQHGQPLPMSVVVAPFSGTGVPSGDFDLMTGKYGSFFGGTLLKGRFSGGVTGLPGGDYQMKAQYSGDAMFASSQSAAVAVKIAPEDSMLNVQPYYGNLGGFIVPLTGPMLYGSPFGLQINVQGNSGVGSASGTVAIQMDGKIALGTFPLNQGGNVFAGFGGPLTGLEGLSSTGLLVGNHTLTVSYSGDNSFKPSNATPVSVTVEKVSPQTGVRPFQEVYTANVPIDFVLVVSPNGAELPTGFVQLFDCGTASCPRPVKIGGPLELHSTGPFGTGATGAGAQATYQGSFSAGTHVVEVGYFGDSNYLSVQPGSVVFVNPASITVNPPAGMEAKMALQQSPGTITVGQSENYLISVMPSQAHGPMPTGTVTISDQWGDYFPPVSLTNGNATLVAPWFYAGPEFIYMSYSGDANYAPVNTAVVATTTVKPGVPTVTLTSSAAAVAANSKSVLTVTVQVPYNPNVGTPAAEGGKVEFFDSVNGAAPLALGSGPQPLTTANGGNAIFILPAVLPPGTNVITAKFLGTSEWIPKDSNPVLVDVK